MRRRAGTRIAGALAVAIGSGLLLIGPAGAPARAQEDFEVTGEVDNLYPGVETTLAATVTNPQPFTIEVTTLGVRALDAGPACPGSLLTFGGLVATVEVPPGATVPVSVTVELDSAAPDACQGATWALELTGTAVADTGESGGGAAGGSGGGAVDTVARTGAWIAGLTAVGLAAVAVGASVRALAARLHRTDADHGAGPP